MLTCCWLFTYCSRTSTTRASSSGCGHAHQAVLTGGAGGGGFGGGGCPATRAHPHAHPTKHKLTQHTHTHTTHAHPPRSTSTPSWGWSCPNARTARAALSGSRGWASTGRCEGRGVNWQVRASGSKPWVHAWSSALPPPSLLPTTHPPTHHPPRAHTRVRTSPPPPTHTPLHPHPPTHRFCTTPPLTSLLWPTRWGGGARRSSCATSSCCGPSGSGACMRVCVCLCGRWVGGWVGGTHTLRARDCTAALGSLPRAPSPLPSSPPPPLPPPHARTFTTASCLSCASSPFSTGSPTSTSAGGTRGCWMSRCATPLASTQVGGVGG